MRGRYINNSQSKTVLKWLTEPMYVWITVAVVVTALVFSLRPGTTETTIRFTGLLLQVLGVLTVIWGIYQIRALFGYPPIRQKIKAWIRRFPYPRHRETVRAGHAIHIGYELGADHYFIHGPATNPTTEMRLDALDKNVQTINERISTIGKEIEHRIEGLGQDIRKERDMRSAQNQQVHRKLEDTGTGGVHISAMGAVWLLFGATMSTAASEIACFLR